MEPTNEYYKVNFEINYKKEIVTFKEKIKDKKSMSLKEFALSVLKIDPISVEVIAMYIGKMGFETYNKEDFKITFNKKTKNGIKGILEIKATI